MKVRYIPVLAGFIAAALYALNAWREYSGGDLGAALNWAIGGMCLTLGYAGIMFAAARGRRKKCRETR